MDHGVPQNRKRWHCIGIRKSAYPNGHECGFHQNIYCSSLDTFLDPGSPSDGAGIEPTHVRTNLESAFKQTIDFGLDPEKRSIAIDGDASSRHMTWNSNTMPCLTRRRYRGHWSNNRERRTTIKEMHCFQGIKLGSFTQTCSVGTGRLIGNAMSLNVAERRLYSLFTIIGMLPSEKLDRWKCLPFEDSFGKIIKFVKANKINKNCR